MERVLVSFLLELFVPMVMTSITADYFRQIKRCSSTQSLGTVIQSFPVTSRIRCASACSTLSTCRAFSVSSGATRTCYLRSDPPTVLTCPSAESNFQKLSYAPCLNNGVYNSSVDACKCFDGYIGSRCEKIMQDCTEGKNYYQLVKRVMWIFPHLAPAPFTVTCLMAFGGVTIMQHHRFGNINFKRSWAEYKVGFGDFNADHWTGNDHVFYITNSRPHVLRATVVSLDVNGSFEQVTRSHYYNNFKISNESDRYRLTFTSDWPDLGLGDCLSSLKGVPFSTFDMDATGVCAQQYSVGWWFKAGTCADCNLNGVIRNDLLYWPGNVKVAHWKPIPNNFQLYECAFFLVAAN